MRFTGLLLFMVLVGTPQAHATNPDSLKSEARRAALLSIWHYGAFIRSGDVSDLANGVSADAHVSALLDRVAGLDPNMIPPRSALDSVRACLTALLYADPKRSLSARDEKAEGSKYALRTCLASYERFVWQAMAPDSSPEFSEIPDVGDPPFDVAPTPLPDHSPQPACPENMRGMYTRGKVVVQVYVDRNGDLRRWRILKAEPRGMGFEEEVLKVIERWQFTPAIYQGNHMPAWVAVPFVIRPDMGDQPPER